MNEKLLLVMFACGVMPNYVSKSHVSHDWSPSKKNLVKEMKRKAS